jgi:two-component system nitrogen regulation response regulator GlnG
MNARILLADDDSSLRFVLSQALGKEGYNVRATGNVATLSKWVRDGEGDLVLSDVYMGEDCVFDALPAMRAARPNLPVIVMSAQSTVSTALSAAGAGAYDYVPKPFDLDELMAAVKRALTGGPDAKTRAQASKAEKEERLPLIGRSLAMQEVYRVMARVSGTDLTVLIEGESGTGKERVARALHDHGRRANAPFITLSLAGAAASQLDRDLFGPDGAFVQAKGGTLFLEDADELTPDAQTRLSGLLHSDSARPNVRLIVAAQRNLATLMRQGAFRQDLFYQLNVVPIRLPPLRDRKDDVGDLARAFLVRAKREGLPEKTLDASAIERLKAYDFPGNVRELENLLRRAAALSPAAVISAREVEHELTAAIAPASAPEGETAASFEQAVHERLTHEFAVAGTALPAPGLYDRLLAEVERPLIMETLQATRGNQIRAAAVLGINRNTLRKKIQALGIRTGRSD